MADPAFFVFDSDGNVFCDAAGYPSPERALRAYGQFREEVPSYDDTVRIGMLIERPTFVVMPNGREAYGVDPLYHGPETVESEAKYRARVAGLANEAGRASSCVDAAPTLSADSPREDLVAWLKWCDGNGIWTDEDLRAEDQDPMTIHDAWEWVERLCDDS